MTAVERLEELLNEKDAEIEELQQRMQAAEEKAEADHTWTRHRVYEDPNAAPNPDLPVPRLEIRWREKDRDADGYSVEAAYSLVYRHLLGWVIFVPLGLTRSDGALSRRIADDGAIDLPFRDGAHFRNEMKQLRLRGFGIVGDHVWEYAECPRCGRLASPNHPTSTFARCILPPLDGFTPERP